GVAGTGLSLEYSGENDALFDLLKTSGVQSFPTLVYSPKKGSSILNWYPRGTGDDAPVEVWKVTEEGPTPESIAEVISRAHVGELITPDQTPEEFRVWVDPSKGWAHRQAEAR